MNTTQQIAVVGGGYWGKNLVRNFANLGALHTICEIDPQKQKEYRKSYPGVNVTGDFVSLLANEEIRGVVIATPAAQHHQMARAALLAGKDVFVEKPLALTVAEGEELIALARAQRKILMVGHILEYHPAVLKLKELISQGTLGKIQYIYSNRLNLGKFRTEENILWSFAPHDISVIILLLGEIPTEVAAHGGAYLNREIADVTVTNLSFASGVKAHIFVSWLHPFKEQKLVVVSSEKMAVFDDLAGDKLVLFNHKVSWIERLPVPAKGEAQKVDFLYDEPLKLECAHFLECLAERKAPRTHGQSALRVLQVLAATQQSLESGGRVVPLKATAVQSETRETQSPGDIFIHPTSIVETDARLGPGTKVWHFSHVMPEVTTGKSCNIGQNVFIGKGVKLGDNVKVQNNASIYEEVILEDNVFCGPSCVFTNVLNPRSHIPRKNEYRPTVVKKGATIGANATIVCGHTIGRYAFIGAGAVVTKDVPDYALVYGNPARLEGWVCSCGVKLEFNSSDTARCQSCQWVYLQKDNRIQELESRSDLHTVIDKREIK